ncbi:uncharacterized protein LOC119585554 [Penaeus monodon]|uniref:uncharacterized protein LOC119585554 n=1 Tax=Penaeus monodon TaxID=6687 RepID=UPI0018A6E282|nr:uncharacterized protein LOC119585554 [Penaeus monodon]
MTFNTVKRLFLKIVQSSCFADELKLLAESKDGLLRVGGRLAHSELEYDARHPLILPKDSPVSKLLIHWQHEKSAHSGRYYVLSHLRQRYWILGAGPLLKKITSTCTVCRRLAPRQLAQLMSDLPADRLSPNKPPFTHSGVDCSRSDVKHYGGIFTCLISRAVLLEVVKTINISSFVMALFRFCARRAERDLKQELVQLDQSQMQEDMLKEGFSWVFNPPAAFHFGGVWEHQIRSVRRILLALLRQQKLTHEGLETLMCEVEAILNSRPLTKSSEDSQDAEPITPKHLLTLKGPLAPPGEFLKEDLYRALSGKSTVEQEKNRGAWGSNFLGGHGSSRKCDEL